MKAVRFTLLPSLFLLLSCCSGCKKTSTATDNDITFDSIRVEKTYHLFNDTTKPACDLQVRFVFPSDYADKKLLKSLQAIFVGKYFGDNFESKPPKEAVAAYVKEYIDSYKEFEKIDNDDPDGPDFELEDGENSPSFSFFEKSHNSIYFNKEGILSFLVSFENYRGGAHGSHLLYGYSVDLNTGKVISDRDIFCENCLDNIAGIIKNKIAEQNKVSEPEELENIGYFDLEKIVPNSNFLLNEKGITYIYNEYEIAPYVMGKTEVFLPYNEISFFLNPRSPVMKLAK